MSRALFCILFVCMSTNYNAVSGEITMPDAAVTPEDTMPDVAVAGETTMPDAAVTGETTMPDAAVTPEDTMPKVANLEERKALREESKPHVMTETTSHNPQSTHILVDLQKSREIPFLPSTETFANTRSTTEQTSVSKPFAGVDLEIVSERERLNLPENQQSDTDSETTADDAGYDLIDLAGRCPYANICSVKGKPRPSRNNFSCCLPCSCEPACKMMGNCCNMSEMERSMCHLPYARTEDYALSNSLEYFMLDTCPKNNNNEVFDCKTVKEYPWGSLYPVYDSSSELNFYNRYCAECNGVRNYTYWDLKLEAINYDLSQTIPISVLFQNNYTLSMLGFIPPKGMDIEKHACSNNLIKACNVSGDWKIYDAKLEQACHRWFSPVLSKASGLLYYANVYCALCNDKMVFSDAECRYYSYDTRVGMFDSFVMVVDYRKIASAINSQSPTDPEASTTGECGKLNVKHPVKAECRTVLCPNGFVRNQKTCEPLSPQWLKDFYFIQLKLTPTSENYIPWSYLELTNKQQTNPSTWLDAQGAPMDYLKMDGEILFEKDGIYCKTIIARVGRKKYPLNIARETYLINKAISKNWTITLRGRAFQFSVKIDKYQSYIADGIHEKIHINKTITYRALYEPGPPEQIYEPILPGSPPSGSDVVLKKTNFCERVRLARSEWSAGYQEIRLNISSAELVLGDSEFDIHVNQQRGMDALICVDDFNPNYRAQRNSVSSAAPIGLIQPVAIVLGYLGLFTWCG